uniref:2-oxoisovalerate dehydrogenase subunit alpha n=1 Tax=Parascaris univalens TaxID=6257 RepID=A0A915BY82_PARUN
RTVSGVTNVIMNARIPKGLCKVRQLWNLLKYSTKAERFQLNEISEKYLSNRTVKFTDKLEVLSPDVLPTFPIYRVLDFDGNIINQANDPKLEKERYVKMYKDMTLLHTMDSILLNSQRQGLLAFYMTNYGEEALHVGCSAGLKNDDLIYAQYREVGVIIQRGYTILEFMNTAFGNCHDLAKGRQMPMHYGSKKHNFVYISSPLATQVPQSVGTAYAFKRAKNGRIVCCFFGDGASSEGDTSASFNFAGALACPVMFVCRNNGYAISTPTAQQYRSDGIAARGPGFGLHAIRVDGNDLLAMYNATKAARAVVAQNKPVLLEALSYRIGDHSTSDDSTAYRSAGDLEKWKTLLDPIARFKKYLIKQNFWSENEETEWIKKAKADVLAAFAKASKEKLPSIDNLFSDVYKKETKNLKRQKEQLRAHLAVFGDKYPVKEHLS